MPATELHRVATQLEGLVRGQGQSGTLRGRGWSPQPVGQGWGTLRPRPTAPLCPQFQPILGGLDGYLASSVLDLQ